MESIEWKKTGELIPYSNNSRTHSEKQVQQVAASIKEFGFTNPILIDEDNGIIAGHGRLQAAQLLGMDTVPTIALQGFSEAQRKAYVIADNQLAMNAGWDFEALRIEVDRLSELDIDIDLLGFDDDFLNDLLFDSDSESIFPDIASGEKEPYQKKTFTLHDEQVAIVDDAVMLARTNPLADSSLNDNSNGNAVTFICTDWLKNNG